MSAGEGGVLVKYGPQCLTGSSAVRASAQFAAMHRTDEDIEALEACHAKLELASEAGDLSAYTKANLEWHVQVVRASHNELLMAFISAISQSVFVATELEGFNSLEVRNAVINAHRKVMDAIKAKDGEAAARPQTAGHGSLQLSDGQTYLGAWQRSRPMKNTRMAITRPNTFHLALKAF